MTPLNCIGCGKSGCDGKAGCEYYDSLSMTQTPPQRSSLEVLRAKIVEAVPEIMKLVCDIEGEKHSIVDGCYEIRPIQLADVLRAIGRNYPITFAIAADGEFERRVFTNTQTIVQRTGYIWNLPLSLDDQPQPVIDFLATILV